MPDDTPKIIVDDDWKSQARAEKQKFAAQDAKGRDNAGPLAGAGDPSGLPDRIGFEDVIRLMATQALMYLGAFPDPQTGKAIIALDLAQLHIELLGVLQAKTKGNLTPDEKAVLDDTVHELRLQFAQIIRALEQARAEGKLSELAPDAGVPGAGPSRRV